LAASACGGSSGAKVAQLTTTGGTNAGHHPQTFSACIRSHGAPNFPDANTERRPSPAFRTAYHSCRKPRRERAQDALTLEQVLSVSGTQFEV
jgi:hypothetical protein